MKRLQISIQPELDEAVGREARKQGVSKAALVRRWVAEELDPLPPLREWVRGERGQPRRLGRRRRRRLRTARQLRAVIFVGLLVLDCGALA